MWVVLECLKTDFQSITISSDLLEVQFDVTIMSKMINIDSTKYFKTNF